MIKWFWVIDLNAFVSEIHFEFCVKIASDWLLALQQCVLRS